MENLQQKDLRGNLIKSLDSFKMVIPNEVEKKIRLLCKNISNIEWSGVLFYTVEGSFKDNSLTIRCMDLFQMDIGSSSFTEYKLNPDVINYMTEHPELLNKGVYQGLIHSHHSMTAFFSETDINTLWSQGKDMNCFVSLIVNNKGKYTAAVTRKITISKTIQEKRMYHVWGDEVIDENVSGYATEEETEVCWNILDIVIEKEVEPFEDEMIARIKEIEELKNREYLMKQKTSLNTVRQPMVTDRKFKEYVTNLGTTASAEKEKAVIPPSLVDRIVAQTITCSAIVPLTTEVTVKNWVKNMEILYTRCFHHIKNFESFAVNFADFLINSAVDIELEEYNSDDAPSELALEVIAKLEEFPSNVWLDKWIEIYYEYTV